MQPKTYESIPGLFLFPIISRRRSANVEREALFQIARGDLMKDIKLPIGGLLVLSGESRYQWKHRVLPETSGESASEDVERVSLVFGFQ